MTSNGAILRREKAAIISKMQLTPNVWINQSSGKSQIRVAPKRDTRLEQSLVSFLDFISLRDLTSRLGKVLSPQNRQLQKMIVNMVFLKKIKKRQDSRTKRQLTIHVANIAQSLTNDMLQRFEFLCHSGFQYGAMLHIYCPCSGSKKIRFQMIQKRKIDLAQGGTHAYRSVVTNNLGNFKKLYEASNEPRNRG